MLAAKVARNMGLAMQQHSNIYTSRRLGFRPKNKLDKNMGKRLNMERVMQKRCSGHNTYCLVAMAGWAGLSPIGILFQHKTSPAELLKCVSLPSIDQFYSLKQHLLSQVEYWSQDAVQSQLHSTAEQHLSQLHTQPVLIHKALASFEAKAIQVFLDSGWYGCSS